MNLFPSSPSSQQVAVTLQHHHHHRQGAGATSDETAQPSLSRAPHHSSSNNQQQQWTNLTPFPYQRDVGKVSDALGLNRRFAFLQDRVIFFRPNVSRKCPNGIMTERVAFITPNGVLHLCDNDAAPKRTLALTELFSIVTDSVSQIALVTDWPLVLRFDSPRYSSSSLPSSVLQQLPTLKSLISLVKFFRPNASLLRCTADDFATVNLNLGKPRQFRAPASFDTLQPPPDKSLDALLEEQELQRSGGTPTSSPSGRPASKQQQQQQQSPQQQESLLKALAQRLRNAAAAATGGLTSPTSVNATSPKRSVQFSRDPPSQVILHHHHLHAQQQQQHTQGCDGSDGGGGSPIQQQQQQQQRAAAMMQMQNIQHNNNNNSNNGRPQRAPTNPADIFAAQQSALFDHYNNTNNNNSNNYYSPSSSFRAATNQISPFGDNNAAASKDEQQQHELYFSKVPIDPKIDKVFARSPHQLSQQQQQQQQQHQGQFSQDASSPSGKRKAHIVEFDRDGNPLPERSHSTSPTSHKAGEASPTQQQPQQQQHQQQQLHDPTATTTVTASPRSKQHYDHSKSSRGFNDIGLDDNNSMVLPPAMKSVTPTSFANRGLMKRAYGTSVANAAYGGDAQNSQALNQNQRHPNHQQQLLIPAITAAMTDSFTAFAAGGGTGNKTNDVHQQVDSFSHYYATLPEKFEGKTGSEARVALDSVRRIEDENERLRREVAELQLRERRMKSDPIPLGRVLPAEAATAGAAVRNLGVLIMSICQRRKLLNQLDTTMAAQRQLMEGNSMFNTNGAADVDDHRRQQNCESTQSPIVDDDI